MAVAQFLGQWAWVIVPWFWVLIYDPDLFSSPAAGVRSLGIWVGLGCMALALTPAIFVRSPSTKDADNLQDLNRENLKANQRALIQSFRDAFRCAPFRKLCAATFLVFGSFQTIAAFGFFIVVYHLFDGDAGAAGTWPGWFASVGALCTTFLVIPIITWASQRLGKKNAFVLSQAVSIVGYALFWWAFRPGTPLLMLAPLPLFACGIGGLFTLMMSMTADVCDLDELDNGLRREGTFGAIYWWMVKFGMAVAGLLSGLIMAVTGFVADAPSQAEGVMTGMRLAYSLVPSIGALLAILVMWKYDVTEERADEIRAELEKRRGKTVFG